MITRIKPSDLDRGERIVALIPVSGRALAVSLFAPLIPLSAGVFILLHRKDLYDFGLHHFFASHGFVTNFIASRTGISYVSDFVASKFGIGIDLAGIAAYALTALVLLAIFAMLGRWAAASVFSNTIELFVRPFRLIPFCLFTTRAVTTKSIIVKSGVFRAAAEKTTLERIKTRVPMFHGYIGQLLDYGSIRIVTIDGIFSVGWVAHPREVCDAFNLAFGSNSFTAEPDPDLMVIDGQARVLEELPHQVRGANRPASLPPPRYPNGDLESKTDLLVRMLIADPDHHLAWSMLAEAYAALGRQDQAAKARRVHQALNGAKVIA